MPVYEYQCEECKQIIQEWMKHSECTDEISCPVCGNKAKKIISLCKFKLNYNPKTDICDWQGNTSQYWDAYKKAKAEGKKVKPGNAD